jgi:hypothetical protein
MPPADLKSQACTNAPPASEQARLASAPARANAALEIGGRQGPEPTRFGDWELRGRCIDF